MNLRFLLDESALGRILLGLRLRLQKNNTIWWIKYDKSSDNNKVSFLTLTI